MSVHCLYVDNCQRGSQQSRSTLKTDTFIAAEAVVDCGPLCQMHNFACLLKDQQPTWQDWNASP